MPDQSGLGSEAKPGEQSLEAVTVVYWGLLRTGLRKNEDTIRVRHGATVREIFAALSAKNGESFNKVMPAGGMLPPNVIVLLDGENIYARSGLHTQLSGENSVHMIVTMTAIAGG